MKRQQDKQVTVKCSDCGFLALRNIVDGELVEADNEYRKYGRPIIEGNERLSLENYPICFVRSFDLEKEGEDAAQEQIKCDVSGQPYPSWEKYILDIINKKRVCSRFAIYQQGYTPRERMDKLLDNQRCNREHRFKLILAVVGAVIGVLGAALGALLTVLIQKALD